MILWTWAWAVKPLSEFVFMAFVRCSIPIWVALSLMGGEFQTGFFEWALDSLGGEVWEESYGLPHGLVKYTVYCRELSFIEDSKVCGIIF